MRPRPGFTLWEMAIVLAIMAVGAALVAPGIARLGTDQQRQPAAELLALLRDSRKAAIDGNLVVTLRLDPVSGHYRADSAGVSGSGVLGEGTLQLDATETLITTAPRLQYVFRSTGAAIGDTVLVRSADRSLMISVDSWSGVARADAR
jgi:prepilin-type N-terminal cleavage/methylation domain-containing protein